VLHGPDGTEGYCKCDGRLDYCVCNAECAGSSAIVSLAGVINSFEAAQGALEEVASVMNVPPEEVVPAMG